MISMNLRLEPLTPESFSPYGDVIDSEQIGITETINYGLTKRHTRHSLVDTHANNGKTAMRLFDTEPVTLPFKIIVMERHPLGSQAFINLGVSPYMIIVGQAGNFDASKLRAFIAKSSQSINYSKGTWHHYCLCLEARTRFMVIDRLGPGSNCEEAHIAKNMEILVDY